jgi:hypothetical protein
LVVVEDGLVGLGLGEWGKCESNYGVHFLL